jgi:hypothetical protein
LHDSPFSRSAGPKVAIVLDLISGEKPERMSKSATYENRSQGKNRKWQ